MLLEGVYNFRNIGEKPTRDGKRVRSGRLFRADELSRLSDADIAHLEDLGIQTVVDFRALAEKDGTGFLPAALNRLPENIARPVALPTEAGAVFSGNTLQAVMVENFLIDAPAVDLPRTRELYISTL